MEIIKDLTGNNYPVIQKYMVYGAAADIVKGALVEAPIEEEVERGAVCSIGTAAGPVDVVGLVTQLHDYSVDGQFTYNGDLTLKTNRPEIDVDVRPNAIYRAQLQEAAALTIYNDSDTVGVDITTADTTQDTDMLNGGYFYDDATEQFRYIEDHDGNSSWILNTATTTAITNANNRKVVVVPSRLYGAGTTQGATLNSTNNGLFIEGDETVLWLRVCDIWIQRNSRAPLERINVGIHDACAVSSAKLFVDFVISDHFFK
jgi:hypothetical protein